MIVKLKITNAAGFISYVDVEVEPESTHFKTKTKAQLKFLNEYINRDVFIKTYDNLTDAKKRAGIKCKTV